MGSLGFLQLGFNGSEIAEVSPCNRYAHFKKILGRGAFKDVYGGFDRVTNAPIAWCQISLDDENTTNLDEIQEKLCSEAVLLKSLNHKNIMKCFSYWVDKKNKTMNMTTELFNCGSLRSYRQTANNINVQTIKNWGRQILEGLHYLHTRNPCIVHRDLKGDNIFFDSTSGEVKIGDFGLATFIQESPLCAVVGTPEYMAPEYYDEEYNELVDIYAFGMCLLELATCEYPYSECTNPLQIFKKVTCGIKPLALGKVKDLEVKEIIEKCLVCASSRPSAFELLKDPFFSSGDEFGQTQFMECDNEARVTSSCSISTSADSCLSDDSVLISSLFSVEEGARRSDLSVDSMLISNLFPIEEEVRDIGLKNNRALCESSMSEVSMNSNVTIAYSSDEVLGDSEFFVSMLTLS